MRASLPVLYALLATLLCPFPAMAASVPPPAPPASEVRAGDAVVTVVPPLPAGAREFELVLLPENGSPVAVSRELPAGVHDVTWRMPRVYSSRARLVVRAGDAHGEWASEPSAWFALAPLSAPEVARLARGQAENQPQVDSATAPPVRVSGTAERSAIEPGGAMPVAVAPQPAPAGAVIARRATWRDAGRRTLRPAPDDPGVARCPVRFPLRN